MILQCLTYGRRPKAPSMKRTITTGSDQPDEVVHASSHVSSYARGQRRRAATRSGWSWRLACHPRSGWFECRSHTVKFFQTPRRGHPFGWPRTINFRWKRIAGIYQHALEPNVPPINFFGSLGNNFLSTHGTSPVRLSTWRKTQRFPWARPSQKVGATAGKRQPQ